jgi:hypothetical protein
MDISKRLIEVSNLHAGEVAALLEAAASEIDLLRDEKADLRQEVVTLRTAHDAAVEDARTLNVAYEAVLHAADIRASKPELNMGCIVCGELHSAMSCPYRLLTAIPSPPKGCEWRLESNRKVWTASCDRQSVVSPVSVQFKFCPTCGLPISIKAEVGKP